MGTKNNPGNYDCYAKADPDEPIFTLRGKDVSAPYLVRMWAAVREGNFALATSIVTQMESDPRITALIGQCEKFDECKIVAEDMQEWRHQLDRVLGWQGRLRSATTQEEQI